MGQNNRVCMVQMNYAKRPLSFLLALAFLLATTACHQETRIAVIPRTTGTMLWEAVHSGANAAAPRYGFRIYWNAPTREDDVENQIALLERIRTGGFGGVVLAPDQPSALITTVRKLVRARVPVVIINSGLPLAPLPGLCYILNDDEETGRLAARSLGKSLNGAGRIALLSLDPNLLGVMAQVRAFEDYLTAHYPAISIVDRRLGAFNGAEVQQATADVLDRNPQVTALICFTAVATRGAYLALCRRHLNGKIRLIGCEQDGDIIEAVSHGDIDALLAEDSYQMGRRAIEAIAAMRRGETPIGTLRLKPLLITPGNVNTPEIKTALNFGWSDSAR